VRIFCLRGSTAVVLFDAFIEMQPRKIEAVILRVNKMSKNRYRHQRRLRITRFAGLYRLGTSSIISFTENPLHNIPRWNNPMAKHFYLQK
jgi:hypothetical protein